MAREKKPRTKRVPRAMLERFGSIVDELVRSKFGGNQTAAAKALECSQSTISSLISGDRGPGLNTLVAVHHLTGRSLDDILGIQQTVAGGMIATLADAVNTELLMKIKVQEAALAQAKHDLEEVQATLRAARKREKHT